MKRSTLRIRYRVLAASLCVAASYTAAAGARADDRMARGAYLVEIIGCGDCHTPGAFLGKPDIAHKLSGGDVGFRVPGLGYFWGPNLTPDRQTGLGSWSEADIVAAIRTGVVPGGRKLAPSMPYNDFAALTDNDALAIAAYLKSLAPTKNAVPDPVAADGRPGAPYLTVVFPK